MGHKKIKITASFTKEQWAMISRCCYPEADFVRDNPSMLKEDRAQERKLIKTLSKFSDMIDKEIEIGSYHPSFQESKNDSLNQT